MWVAECLEGTIRFDFTSEDRGVWYDLIILGGRMRRKGVIAAGPGRPYPRSYIAGVLNITEDLLERVIAMCKETDRITEDGDGLRIINWKNYQSEYDRQKPYRDKKKAQRDEDPGKYTKGKFGHLVKTSLDEDEED